MVQMKLIKHTIVVKLRPSLLAVLGCAVALGLCVQMGCAPGIVAVLGTPTSAEKKNPAEYNLAGEKDKKILVLVDQPYYLSTHPNLRYLVTDSTNKMLQQRLKTPPELLIDYDTLAEFRSNTSDFSLLTPDQVGAKLGADLVLLIVITDCRISEMSGAAYVDAASLDAYAQLISVPTGQKLWPTLEQARAVKVGFESERRGPDAAAVRLAVATAHCVARYLYNCPQNQFRISDEKTETGWEKLE
jgi:hypothetical protein